MGERVTAGVKAPPTGGLRPALTPLVGGRRGFPHLTEGKLPKLWEQAFPPGETGAPLV